ncbi:MULTISPECIES: methyl-accepting chemotaxis protein [Xanthomonas]|uniref:methyl-accepting chemotaxis protein n=1 Tax=Xanthomonas TaxID=338 RepID=UPI001AD98D83|nr:MULTISPECIES: methyl-accepting chemotaxis protein [Xanthomonas]MBO9855279.1 MCP four helix bundle domain-containing protein [Xanthomonas sp. A1809]MBV6866984.1 MCP four helix bundle domain-containing protein [Xanthomonas campestris pv. coriandri]MCE4329607.1 methyl-accepting chemotaxis protein [Xanthomonas campestris pv. coriandri]
MIGFLQRYNVGTRLSAAFGFLILLSCGLVVAGLTTLAQARGRMDSIVKRNMTILEYVGEMRSASADIAVNLRNIVLPTTQEENIGFAKIVEQQRQYYSDIHDKLYAIPPSDANGAAMRRQIDLAREKARVANQQVLDLGMNGKPDQALKALMQQAAPANQQWQDALNAYAARQRSRGAAAYADANTAMDRGRALLIAGGLAVILVSSLLAWWITRSLTQPLSRATRAAEAIAEGRLDSDVYTTATDEPGRLLSAMARMQTQLQRFSGETTRMIALHADKDMTHRMPQDFPGVYGELSKGINTMMFEHLDAIVDAIEVLNEYARGDLRRDARRLPGSRAVLHESMDAAKASLLAINTEIKRLASAAAAGDFSARGDAQRFEHDFLRMVQDLNAMMEVSDTSLVTLSSVLQSIAAGDLTARMHGNFHGVFAKMRDDANATTEQLTRIVVRIQGAAGNISAATGEIAAGNQDLSQRTEQQAANLEETAASMEELTSTVKQNAESARQANQLAIGAARVAAQGGQIASKVVETMSGIESSSRKIADIISVIDGISFQTNILALNAAVEAARAGEQGRGFAVVASEVRTLAQRSTAAAKEIKSLIDDSVQRVAEGSLLVHSAGTTMAEIVTSVQRVTDIMGEISAASQEQSSGIEQVNQTVTQMDETTQQNAALVEEATAAARALEEQALGLTEAVAVFKTDSSDASQASRAASRRPAAAPALSARAAAAGRAPAATLRAVVAAPSNDSSWQEF